MFCALSAMQWLLCINVLAPTLRLRSGTWFEFPFKKYKFYKMDNLNAFVCVFIPFHLLASSECKTSVTYLRCSDQRSFVMSIARGFCQVPSSPYLKMSYLTSKEENSSHHKLKRKRYDLLTASQKMTYIDIGYKSAPN